MVGRGFIAKLWNWFDNSFLLWATGFLIAFIPLYPKIPIGELIPGYIVRLRLEDVLIGVLFVWWGIQALRRKVPWKTPLTLFMVAYLITGLASNILGVVVTKTIPPSPLHFGKSMLHWFRHIEYFSLFFLAYSAVRSKRDAVKLVVIAALTAIAVVAYGYGQKYLYWPVYSTMNREFSKGIRLYLGEHARVQSTFAGHYDLGAYLVIVLPLFLAFYFGLGKFVTKEKRVDQLRKVGRWLFFIAWLGGIWLLALSASRTSFLAYLLAAGLVVGLYMFKRGWKWGISRGISVLLVSILMMVLVGELTSRFGQLIDQNKHPQLHKAFHTVNDYLTHPSKLIGMTYEPQKPENAISVDELEKQLNEQGLTVSDSTPVAQKPQDVYVNVPEQEFELDDPAATLAGDVKQVGDKLVVDRTFSDCALERSLSLCIRFETLWPRAIQGFWRNPLFGSGYATLNKTAYGEFTDAESTDNNFLRTLGENGLLGFFFYYGLSGLVVWYAWLTYRRCEDVFLQGLAIAVISGTFGLLLNATYIDVFVASKVAYTFWTLQGIALAVFVKEGVVAPRFAFERQRLQSDTSKLSALLAQAEQKQAARSETAAPYLSSQKKRVKSGKKRRTQRQGR